MAVRKRPTLAESSDRHALYEASVQCAETEIDFVDETFRRLRGRRAQSLREDFCGTAKVACEWVRRGRGRTAIGVDRDPAVLAWGRRHNVAALPRGAARRVALVEGDVLMVRLPAVDLVLAMNFSYWVFKERGRLRRYFRRAYAALAPDGILYLDAYGGYEAFKVLKERTPYRGYTYVWHQAAYDPISGDTLCHIDFKFEDGSRLKRAFSYDWRLWTLPELREVLAEAGFRRSTVYWQGSDEHTGHGDGVFLPVEKGEPDAGWIAYIVAEK